MSRSFCTVRSGSERKVHWAPIDPGTPAACDARRWRWWRSQCTPPRFWGKSRQLQVLLVLLGAVVAAREGKDQRVFPLQLAQPAGRARVIGQLVVRKAAPGIGAHGCSLIVQVGSSVPASSATIYAAYQWASPRLAAEALFVLAVRGLRPPECLSQVSHRGVRRRAGDAPGQPRRDLLQQPAVASGSLKDTNDP